jgi:hypothetical protein
MIYLLNAIELPTGGSSTVHIYTQTPGGSSTVHIYTQTPGDSSTVQIYTQTPGDSSTVHIYTQTIHRTTQNKQYIEQHKNFGRVPAVSRLCELYPGICLTTEEIAWRNKRYFTFVY